MKSSKTMVAILAVSTLGLTPMAIAETQEAAEGTSDRQAAAERADRNRQSRGERSQSTDTERRSARQQRREAGQGTEGGGDAGEERRARRSRTDPENNTGEAGRSDNRRRERRDTAEARTNRRGYERRGDRHNASRHARIRDGMHNDGRSRSGFKRTHGDHRNPARAERRRGNRAEAKHRGFDNRVERRLSNQRARTRAGWKNGDLNRKELKRIRKDQHKIARMDRRFGSDGRYTRHERRKLNKALDRSSRRVHRAKNNHRLARETRPGKRRW